MHLSLGQALAGLLAAFSTASALSTPPVNNTNVNNTNIIYNNVSIADVSITNVSTTLVTSITSITSTGTSAPLPNPLEKRSPTPSNLACYNQQKGCKNKVVYEEEANKYAADICNGKRFKGVFAKPGWEGTAGWRRNPSWISYNVKVEWKTGCKMPCNGGMKIDSPVPGVSCHDLVHTTWKNCKGNGGRGGKIEIGCLEYHYNTINGDEAGVDHCHDVPFGNYTG
ncbi:hypothetical protein DHEL01_v202016 [Diaporthe helianthi]|uniref:Secreted protein n=1 Tax=Diaporthe helianthi TaxID=158607 RepID=A0A2P5IAS3_DIAHE|nr:hypothetical protein DHEL01_v202016 [Diaporthe helianthi]